MSYTSCSSMAVVNMTKHNNQKYKIYEKLDFIVTLSLLSWAFILVATILTTCLVGLRVRSKKGVMTPVDKVSSITITLIIKIILMVIIPSRIINTSLTTKIWSTSHSKSTKGLHSLRSCSYFKWICNLLGLYFGCLFIDSFCLSRHR